MRAHAELIKQWAEDETAGVEVLDISGRWAACFPPTFSPSHKYRIKPKEKKKVEMWLWVLQDSYQTFAGVYYFATKAEAEAYYKSNVICRIEGSKIEVEE